MKTIKKGIKMIRYSNTPDKFATVITDSPTSPVITTGNSASGNDGQKPSQTESNLNDNDAQDENGTD